MGLFCALAVGKTQLEINIVAQIELLANDAYREPCINVHRLKLPHWRDKKITRKFERQGFVIEVDAKSVGERSSNRDEPPQSFEYYRVCVLKK